MTEKLLIPSWFATNDYTATTSSVLFEDCFKKPVTWDSSAIGSYVYNFDGYDFSQDTGGTDTYYSGEGTSAPSAATLKQAMYMRWNVQSLQIDFSATYTLPAHDSVPAATFTFDTASGGTAVYTPVYSHQSDAICNPQRSTVISSIPSNPPGGSGTVSVTWGIASPVLTDSSTPDSVALTDNFYPYFQIAVVLDPDGAVGGPVTGARAPLTNEPIAGVAMHTSNDSVKKGTATFAIDCLGAGTYSADSGIYFVPQSPGDPTPDITITSFTITQKDVVTWS